MTARSLFGTALLVLCLVATAAPPASAASACGGSFEGAAACTLVATTSQILIEVASPMSASGIQLVDLGSAPHLWSACSHADVSGGASGCSRLVSVTPGAEFLCSAQASGAGTFSCRSV